MENLTARQLVIHGANLSVGGPVPVGSYGVGASPICQEANRLMRSGVVVCVAAGNSGHQTFLVPSEDADGNPAVGFHDAFMNLSIEDPANAEDVITRGLRSVNVGYAGSFKPGEGAELDFTPLLKK